MVKKIIVKRDRLCVSEKEGEKTSIIKVNGTFAVASFSKREKKLRLLYVMKILFIFSSLSEFCFFCVPLLLSALLREVFFLRPIKCESIIVHFVQVHTVVCIFLASYSFIFSFKSQKCKQKIYLSQVCAVILLAALSLSAPDLKHSIYLYIKFFTFMLEVDVVRYPTGKTVYLI